MLRRLIFGKFTKRIIDEQQARITQLVSDLGEARHKIYELMDLRRELKVIVHKTEYGRMDVNIVVSKPSPISITDEPLNYEDCYINYETVFLNRCVGYQKIETWMHLEEASEKLQHLVAGYCGEFLTNKIKEDLQND